MSGPSVVLACNVGVLDAGDAGSRFDVDYGFACRTDLNCGPLVREGIGPQKSAEPSS